MEGYIVIPQGIKLVSSWKVDLCRRDYSTEDTFILDTYMNENIYHVYMPDSVETIGDKAFEHCKNLTTIYLSANLKKIGFNALWGCDIENAYYPGSMLEYDKIDNDSSGRPNFKYFHCKEGTFDFSNPKYINNFPFAGTINMWNEKYGNHWLNRRAGRILCTDGVIDCK